MQVERRHINLTMYGTFGVAGKFTAMAQTVGWPTAMAAKLILNGRLVVKLFTAAVTFEQHQVD